MLEVNNPPPWRMCPERSSTLRSAADLASPASASVSEDRTSPAKNLRGPDVVMSHCDLEYEWSRGQARSQGFDDPVALHRPSPKAKERRARVPNENFQVRV